MFKKHILILSCTLQLIVVVNSNGRYPSQRRNSFEISNDFKNSNKKISSNVHSGDSNPDLKNLINSQLDLPGSTNNNSEDGTKSTDFRFKRFSKKKSKRHLKNKSKLRSSRLNLMEASLVDYNKVDDGGGDPGEKVDDLNENILSIKPIKYHQLYERRKRYAEKKKDNEGMMEVCDNSLCSDRGICRIYMTADYKVQLCSCYPGYEGDICQLEKPDPDKYSLPEKGKQLGLNSDFYNKDKHDRVISDKSNKLNSDDDYVDYYEYGHDESVKSFQLKSGLECEGYYRLLLSRETPPWTVVVLLVCCLLIAMISIITVIMIVDGDRRVLLERYELLSRLGYEVERPDDGFLKLLSHRAMFLCCCLCHCCPWIDCCYCLQSIQNYESEMLLSAAKSGATPTTPRSRTITWAPTTPLR